MLAEDGSEVRASGTGGRAEGCCEEVKIERSQPRSAGVESLMYVGDATVAPLPPSKTELGVGALGVLLMLFGKGSAVRAIGAGAAAYIGYRVYKSKP